MQYRQMYFPKCEVARNLEGGPSFPYPFDYFEKYPISLKETWQISPIFRKHCIPIPKIYQSIPYPFKYLQKYPVSIFKFLANIPVSLKTLPGPKK